MKLIDTDGPPPAGEHVLADCGPYRCLARLDAEGKWIAPFSGQEIQHVVGYYPMALLTAGEAAL